MQFNNHPGIRDKRVNEANENRPKNFVLKVSQISVYVCLTSFSIPLLKGRCMDFALWMQNWPNKADFTDWSFLPSSHLNEEISPNSEALSVNTQSVSTA